MSLNNIATVTISLDTAGVQQVGFGTLLLATYHTKWAGRTKVYTEASEALTDGFGAKSPTYRMLERAFSQNPRPERVKVGRCALPATHVTRLTPVVANSTLYSIKLETCSHAGVYVSGTAEFTSDASATAEEICEGLNTAITALALTGVTSLSLPAGGSSTYVEVTGASGLVVYFSAFDPTLIALDDRTADPGIATDLAAIQNADSDWYGFATDQNGRLFAEEAADWAESQVKMYATNTSDSLAPDGAATTDIGYVLKAKTYGRTVCVANKKDTSAYGGVAMLAERLPHDVEDGFGGGTWAFKVLTGVGVDAWTPTELTNLRAKNYITFNTIAGLNRTLDGKTAGGEFADITRGVDWLKIRMQERIVQAQVSNQKIPFTDTGISIIQSCVSAQLSDGVTGGLLASDPAPAVSVPKASAVSAPNKAARTLTGVKFTATLAGAIHLTQITGNVSA